MAICGWYRDGDVNAAIQEIVQIVQNTICPLNALYVYQPPSYFAPSPLSCFLFSLCPSAKLETYPAPPLFSLSVPAQDLYLVEQRTHVKHTRQK